MVCRPVREVMLSPYNGDVHSAFWALEGADCWLLGRLDMKCARKCLGTGNPVLSLLPRAVWPQLHFLVTWKACKPGSVKISDTSV